MASLLKMRQKMKMTTSITVVMAATMNLVMALLNDW